MIPNQHAPGLRRRLAPALTVAALAALLVVDSRASAREGTPSRETIRKTLKDLWDSLDSLEIRVLVFNLDGSGEPDLAKGYSRIDFARASGGRYMYKTTGVWPDREEVSTNFREDGKRGYQCVTIPGHDDVVDVLNVVNQKDTADKLEGFNFDLLMHFMPFGRPVHAYLDEGASLEVEKEKDGKETFVLKFQPPNKVDVRIELDPEHDWLPRRLDISSVWEGKVVKAWESKVVQFQRDNGRWFPVETWGRHLFNPTDLPRRSKVSELKINRPIADSLFGQPKVNDGTVISDHVTGKGRVQGGPAGAKRLEQEFIMKDPQGTGEPIRADRFPPQFPWMLAVGASSVVLIAAALTLKFRQSRASA